MYEWINRAARKVNNHKDRVACQSKPLVAIWAQVSQATVESTQESTGDGLCPVTCLSALVACGDVVPGLALILISPPIPQRIIHHQKNHRSAKDAVWPSEVRTMDVHCLQGVSCLADETDQAATAEQIPLDGDLLPHHHDGPRCCPGLARQNQRCHVVLHFDLRHVPVPDVLVFQIDDGLSNCHCFEQPHDRQ